jgi:transcription elongation factor Elf1
MKIIDKAVRKVYRFNCPNCGSRLEAECQELVDIGSKISRFHCPICRKDRYIEWSALRKKIVYEGDIPLE